MADKYQEYRVNIYLRRGLRQKVELMQKDMECKSLSALIAEALNEKYERHTRKMYMRTCRAQKRVVNR